MASFPDTVPPSPDLSTVTMDEILHELAKRYSVTLILTVQRDQDGSDGGPMAWWAGGAYAAEGLLCRTARTGLIRDDE